MTDKTQSESTEEEPTRKDNARVTGGEYPQAHDINADSPLTVPGFFKALSAGQLVGGRCTTCETVLLPPRPVCFECGGREITIEEQPKTGTIVSHTMIHKAAPAFSELEPFPVAIVELDSSGRLPGRVDAPYDQISIGDSVQVEIREPSKSDETFALDHEQDWPLHVFVPHNE